MNDQRRARMAAQVRSHRGPPQGAEDRVLAAIRARLGGPPDGGSGGSAGGPSAAPRGAELVYFAKIAAATVSLTVGGLVAIRLVAVGVHVWRDAPVAPADAVVVVESETPAVEPAPSPAVDAAPLEADARARDEAPKVRARTVRTPTSEANIAAELELLGRARNANSPAAAIGLLEEHARRFPSGSLSDERDALWSIASCEQGQIADARTRALELARRRPHSPLLERVAKRCPALAPDLKSAVEE